MLHGTVQHAQCSLDSRYNDLCAIDSVGQTIVDFGDETCHRGSPRLDELEKPCALSRPLLRPLHRMHPPTSAGIISRQRLEVQSTPYLGDVGHHNQLEFISVSGEGVAEVPTLFHRANCTTDGEALLKQRAHDPLSAGRNSCLFRSTGEQLTLTVAMNPFAPETSTFPVDMAGITSRGGGEVANDRHLPLSKNTVGDAAEADVLRESRR